MHTPTAKNVLSNDRHETYILPFLLPRFESHPLTCICFFQRSSLTGPTALPGSPSPPVAEDFHMRAVMAWRMHTVRRACRAQHGAWLGKMEGEPANHATRLVATLTRTCQSVQN